MDVNFRNANIATVGRETGGRRKAGRRVRELWSQLRQEASRGGNDQTISEHGLLAN